jgi:hypothetical protein
MEPETTPARKYDPWACILCGKTILSAFVWVPVICDRRGRPLYTARAHAACCDLAAQGLTGDDLSAARTALAAGHDGLARLVASWQPAGQAVTL